MSLISGHINVNKMVSRSGWTPQSEIMWCPDTLGLMPFAIRLLCVCNMQQYDQTNIERCLMQRVYHAVITEHLVARLFHSHTVDCIKWKIHYDRECYSNNNVHSISHIHSAARPNATEQHLSQHWAIFCAERQDGF